jgi:hypothetical protein
MYKRIYPYILVYLFFTLLIESCATTGVKETDSQSVERAIVIDGNPVGSILLQEGYSEREEEGALELQEYIQKSTGARIPIIKEPEGYTIRIKVRELGEGESREAFSISVGANQTDIIGNSPLGTLYGVYDFLEEVVGVRWYLPGDLGEVVPKKSDIILPSLDYKESPSFPMRWVGLIRVRHRDNYPQSELEKADEWMLKNKQNGCMDGFNIFPDIYHTQNYWLSHEDYFEEHPEYFALIDGKRSTQYGAKLCYSNPEVAREIAKNMSAALDSMPGIDMVSFSPTDGQLWCECEGCRAMDEEGVPMDQSKSRRSLIFYNRIAKELKKTHPEVKILVGAYNVYNWPPKDTTIKADPMLNVVITHYEQYCLAHPVPDPTCPPNRRYVKLIKKWEDLLGGNIYFYEYYNKGNWLSLPWPIVHSIKEDMPWYKEQGYQGLYTQYSTQNIWTLYPVHYVAARLLWDVNINVDSLVDRMYEDLFKKAAPWIKEYYSIMEKQTSECGEHFPGHGVGWPENEGYGKGYGPFIFTKSIRKRLREYYQKAVEANEDPTVALRLKKIGTSLEWVERLMHYADLMEEARRESNPQRAYAIGNRALAIGEELLDEISRDRIKWSGVVTGSMSYFKKSVDKWKIYISEMRP